MTKVLSSPFLSIIAGWCIGAIIVPAVRESDTLAILGLWVVAEAAIVGGLILAAFHRMLPEVISVVIRQTVIFCTCFSDVLFFTDGH